MSFVNASFDTAESLDTAGGADGWAWTSNAIQEEYVAFVGDVAEQFFSVEQFDFGWVVGGFTLISSFSGVPVDILPVPFDGGAGTEAVEDFEEGWLGVSGDINLSAIITATFSGEVYESFSTGYGTNYFSFSDSVLTYQDPDAFILGWGSQSLAPDEFQGGSINFSQLVTEQFTSFGGFPVLVI